MTNTKKFAETELNILEKTFPDAVVTPFRDELLSLCEAFGNSGQSGGSAPYTATILAKTIKNLLLQEPICEITGIDEEWIDVFEAMGDKIYQNKRCCGLFKNPDGTCNYIDAIVWREKTSEGWVTFTGKIYVDDIHFELISSSQNVNFPFKPKTFYVDVVSKPITEEVAISENISYTKDIDGSCHYTIVKNPKQLKRVFRYYTKRKINNNGH